MAYKIELKRNSNINFEFNGDVIRLTAPRWNKYMYTLLTDITINGETVYGIPLRGGVDLLRQFNTPMNLYVINADNVISDPITQSALRLYVLEQTDLQEIRNG